MTARHPGEALPVVLPLECLHLLGTLSKVFIQFGHLPVEFNLGGRCIIQIFNKLLQLGGMVSGKGVQSSSIIVIQLLCVLLC